jgi:hypothetical protein
VSSISRERRGDDRTEGVLLVFSRGLVKCNQGPIHFALRKIGTQIASDPELRAVKIDGAVVSAVHLVSIVELARVSCLAMFVVGGRFSVE